MKTKYHALLVAVVLASAATSLTWLQSRTVSKLESENRQLNTLAVEAQNLAAENRQIPDLKVITAQVEQLRGETSDLQRIRNEVHQLRDRQMEAKQELAQNERLRKLYATGTTSNGGTAAAIAFTTPAELVDLGQATAEAAIQTFFWAMREGNIDRSKACMINPEEMGVDQTNSSPEDLSAQMKKEAADIRGLRVLDRAPISTDEIKLTVQIVEEGIDGIHEIPFKARRVGRDWKFDR
ncbi:MAG: hypothetical protein JWM99_5232 [Verrucomicrobiales bacterium]|jgi:hypothetical protein|nr:hypothetical protein [Verrucomicrobiales bacterium]